MARFGCFMMKSGFLSNRLVLLLEDKRLINTNTSFFVPGKKKPLHSFVLINPFYTDTFVSFQSFFKKTIGSQFLDLQKQNRLLST